MFTDLVGFTTIAEQMDPLALRKILTVYFGEMVEAMQEQNGTLDKFIGDAMMCFFGVPVHSPYHARQGAMTALEMQRRLQALNADWKKRGMQTLGMRIVKAALSGVSKVSTRRRLGWRLHNDK